MRVHNLLLALPFVLAPSIAMAQATILSLDRVNIAGPWKCQGKCQIPGGGTKIETPASSATVICTNEVGQISVGVFATVASISCWGLTGRISEDLKAIDWGNQTQWVK